MSSFTTINVEIDKRTEVSSAEICRPLSAERQKEAITDLIDIDLRLKSAGEESIIKGFQYSEKIEEPGILSVSYEMTDGFQIELELGDIPEEARKYVQDPKNSELFGDAKHYGLRANYLGVRKYRVTNTHTGETQDYLQNATPVSTALNIRLKPYSRLQEHDSDSVQAGGYTGETIGGSQFNTEIGVVFSPIPFTIEDLAIQRHEQAHANDQERGDELVSVDAAFGTVTSEYLEVDRIIKSLGDNVDADLQRLQQAILEKLKKIGGQRSDLFMQSEEFATTQAIDAITTLIGKHPSREGLIKRVRKDQLGVLGLYYKQTQHFLGSEWTEKYVNWTSSDSKNFNSILEDQDRLDTLLSGTEKQKDQIIKKTMQSLRRDPNGNLSPE